MKAVVCTKYGSPDVLQLREVVKPIPEDNEILVKVHSTTVQAGDVRARSFNFAPWFWLLGRLMIGLRKPRKSIPGSELAGEVEAIGKNVKLFKVGDQVFGSTWEMGFGGACAEYKCLDEDGMVTTKPVNTSYGEAAALVEGALSALYFLRKSNIQKGQNILIIGASGGVGTAAVQLAKHFGAEITGVCSSTNQEMVKSLGADKIIDYTKEDFTRNGQTYDFIFDAVIKTSFSRCKKSLKINGTYLTVDWPLLQALWTSIIGSRKIVFGMAPQSIEDLNYLKGLIKTGKIRSVVDRSYPLEKVAEAHRYVEKGHKKGNVVINVITGNNN